MDPKLTPGAAGGEGVLANFFNSLLNKKAGTPGTPGSMNTTSSPRTPTNGINEVTPDQNSMRTDAAAELDRLTRSVQKDMDFSQSDSEQWTPRKWNTMELTININNNNHQ